VPGAPAAGAATLVAPTGIIATTTPTYTWNAVASATQYCFGSTTVGLAHRSGTNSTGGLRGGTERASAHAGVELTPGAAGVDRDGQRSAMDVERRDGVTGVGTPPPGAATAADAVGSIATTTADVSPGRRGRRDAIPADVDDSSAGRVRQGTRRQRPLRQRTGTCSLTLAVCSAQEPVSGGFVTKQAVGQRAVERADGYTVGDTAAGPHAVAGRQHRDVDTTSRGTRGERQPVSVGSTKLGRRIGVYTARRRTARAGLERVRSRRA